MRTEKDGEETYRRESPAPEPYNSHAVRPSQPCGRRSDIPQPNHSHGLSSQLLHLELDPGLVALLFEQTVQVLGKVIAGEEGPLGEGMGEDGLCVCEGDGGGDQLGEENVVEACSCTVHPLEVGEAQEHGANVVTFRGLGEHTADQHGVHFREVCIREVREGSGSRASSDDVDLFTFVSERGR